MKTRGDRDWRSWAYLQKSNWPEAIPWMGPQREHGPQPWSPKKHDDPHDLDNYPNSHVSAASVGEMYMGDVCPYCGVPIRWDEKVVLLETGDKGIFHKISDLEDPEPAYHPVCWYERECERGDLEYVTFDHYE